MLKAYMKEIADTTKRGDAREESYYGSLADLLSDFPLEEGRATDVTTLPKKTDAGNPDFRVWDGDHFIVGYIEAKTPGTNLDQIETSEQLERYLNTFPNLILTDFYEFRLYREGQLIDRVTIGRHFTARQLKTTPVVENADEFEALMAKFFAFKLPKSFTAEKLAVDLAKRTRFLRDQVVAEELRDESTGGGDLSGFFNAFKQYLIAGLTQEQFADLYSQTITYGLFAAKTRAEGHFNRKLAFDYIPSTIGILRDVFRFISLGELSPQMEVIVDDITAVLNAADINSILDQYYKEGKGEDPIVHFYETFLNEYDPETRERRGVYYTPEPVVKYIVRSVHQLLKDKFDLRDGLADPKVTLLDPAAGTLTFPAEAIKLAVVEYVEKYGEGGKKGFIRDQILKNYYAFELMMAPYAIGHMKISILLESLGYKLQADDRFQLYLTNTLEMEEIDQIGFPGLHSLSEESQLAGKVKKEEPILVIMGNPPYSGISSNINDWTEELLKTDIDGAQSYYKVDGKPLGEKKVWLQDDYVKFMRFAQWKIHKAGKGIVAMITNHSYLDNPTFRGMRQSLMKTFDEIYILDLHGNSLIKETTPDGSKDENVFDIRQGVAIALFLKNIIHKDSKVKHAEKYGTRETKYKYLISHNIISAGYDEIDPKAPYFFFIPRYTDDIQHYSSWLSVDTVFPLNITGIVTARDRFVIGLTKQELELRIMQFRNLSIPNEVISQTYGLKNTRGWDLSSARKELANDNNWQNYFQKIFYRPFDIRYIFYTPIMVDWGRNDFMHHMLSGENYALVLPKRVEYVGSWQNALVTDKISEHVAVSLKTTDYHFPLYVFPKEEQIDWTRTSKTVNINELILNTLNEKYDRQVTPEKIFSYIYGILYSDYYRAKYVDFLRMDFPRIPFTLNYTFFTEIARLGQRLIDLHLLKSPELAQPNVKFQGQGEDLTVGRRRYDEETERVYINKDYYFEGVAPEVWAYQIGGYQVMDKYLKDRKGRRMEDPRHYIHIATALEKTIEIQAEIDAIYPEVEKDVIQF
ncbi:MAG TPA: DNA methyltransferase [Anaerolineaceae bacterium]|nr:DNA methyltransferase [Anaerolineaceae bacterium]